MPACATAGRVRSPSNETFWALWSVRQSGGAGCAPCPSPVQYQRRPDYPRGGALFWIRDPIAMGSETRELVQRRQGALGPNDLRNGPVQRRRHLVCQQLPLRRRELVPPPAVGAHE